MLEKNSIMAALAKGKAAAQPHEICYVQVHSHAHGFVRFQIDSEDQIDGTIQVVGDQATAELVIEPRAGNGEGKWMQKRFAI